MGKSKVNDRWLVVRWLVTRISYLSILLLPLTTPSLYAGVFDDIGNVLKKTDKALDTAQKVKSVLPMTTGEEIELGESISQQLREEYGVYQDTEITKYVSLVGRSVALNSERKDLEYTFIILDTSLLNAFAAPGGFVFITKGLLLIIENESQLATALGHEIVHIDKRHIPKAIQKSNILNIAISEALKDKNGEGWKKLVKFSSDMVFNGVGRKEELESDILGTKYVYQIGYKPDGLLELLKIMEENRDKSETLSLSFFKKHPSSKERIEKLQGFISKEKMDISLPNLKERYGLNKSLIK